MIDTEPPIEVSIGICCCGTFLAGRDGDDLDKIPMMGSTKYQLVFCQNSDYFQKNCLFYGSPNDENHLQVIYVTELFANLILGQQDNLARQPI